MMEIHMLRIKNSTVILISNQFHILIQKYSLNVWKSLGHLQKSSEDERMSSGLVYSRVF